MTDQPAATALWMDWITIWQSEMAALAADREVQEAMQRAVDLTAANAGLLAAFSGTGHDPAGRAGPAATAGSAAAGDAAARDAQLRSLRDRVAALERRLGSAA